jgi:hypothetical protein
MKYKGTYRLLPELDLSTNDFPRCPDGSIEDIDIYISCQYGNKIKCYGHIDNKKPVWLIAYVSSIGRARNIKKALDELEIEYIDYIENDIEADFKFKAKDIDVVAKLMKAKTGGAGISPNSVKNLPVSDYTLSAGNLQEYKEITGQLPKGDTLIISQVTNRFMDEILAKKYRRIDINSDMRKKCMARQIKEYIHSMDMWDEYIKYLKREINKHLEEKENE